MFPNPYHNNLTTIGTRDNLLLAHPNPYLTSTTPQRQPYYTPLTSATPILPHPYYNFTTPIPYPCLPLPLPSYHTPTTILPNPYHSLSTPHLTSTTLYHTLTVPLPHTYHNLTTPIQYLTLLTTPFIGLNYFYIIANRPIYSIQYMGFDIWIQTFGYLSLMESLHKGNRSEKI